MAGLSLLLVLGLVAGGWWLLRDEPYRAATGPDAGSSAVPARAAEAVEALERALVGGDPAAARALGAGAAAEQLAGVARNVTALRLRDLDLRYVDEVAPTGGDWRAVVEARWRLAGFDRAVARTEVLVGFRADGERLLVTTVAEGGDRSPLWLSGPLQVRRTPATLVLADSQARGTVDRYAVWARRAVEVVRRVLPRWRGGLVVEVPADGARLHAALGVDPGTYDGIAAVTTSVDGSLAPLAPVHVFVNPDVFAALRGTGSQVVLSHEAVHVATDAALATLPLWLAEGFADYVALRDVELPATTTAGQVIEQVRRQGPPPHLPGPEEFDTARRHLGATYEAAWLACVLIAERSGEQALVRLYQRVDDGVPLARALREQTGLSVEGLTRLWQERLRDLAA